MAIAGTTPVYATVGGEAKFVIQVKIYVLYVRINHKSQMIIQESYLIQMHYITYLCECSSVLSLKMLLDFLLFVKCYFELQVYPMRSMPLSTRLSVVPSVGQLVRLSSSISETAH